MTWRRRPASASCSSILIRALLTSPTGGSAAGNAAAFSIWGWLGDPRHCVGSGATAGIGMAEFGGGRPLSRRRHGPPAGGDGLGLGAKPALAFVACHADLGIPGAPGHVVDPAVAGDIALDGAAGSLGHSHRPALGAKL